MTVPVALEVPGNFLFFFFRILVWPSYFNIDDSHPNGDMVPKIVVVCALALGVSTIALSPFLDQAIVLFIKKDTVTFEIQGSI
jgi:hypothetical protein